MAAFALGFLSYWAVYTRPQQSYMMKSTCNFWIVYDLSYWRLWLRVPVRSLDALRFMIIASGDCHSKCYTILGTCYIDGNLKCQARLPAIWACFLASISAALAVES